MNFRFSKQKRPRLLHTKPCLYEHTTPCLEIYQNGQRCGVRKQTRETSLRLDHSMFTSAELKRKVNSLMVIVKALNPFGYYSNLLASGGTGEVKRKSNLEQTRKSSKITAFL